MRWTLALLFLLGCHEAAPVTVAYTEPRTVAEQAAAATLRAEGVAEDAAAFVHETFRLPHPLTVRVDTSAQAIYDADARTVVLPYRLADELRALFAADPTVAPGEAAAAARDAFTHVLLHEVGHALVDVLDVPVTGREEDAVDDLATLLLLATHGDGDRAALAAADAYDLYSQSYGIEEVDLLDEHSLDA